MAKPLDLMRNLQTHETPLVRYLLQKAGLMPEVSELHKLSVEAIDDGGMGSLRFHTDTKNPKRGSVAAECLFRDRDGIDVSVTLNLDQNEKLFELDIWKVDFSPLIQWPQEHEILDS